MRNWKWVVLDIDGVLIDVSESYDRTVKLTAEALLEELEVEASIPLRTLRSFRSRGRFGDDYQVTEALVLARIAPNPGGLRDQFPEGKGLDWIRERAGRRIDRDRIKPVFDELYLGDDRRDGLWRREKPLVGTDLLDRIRDQFKLGFFTGRSRQEVELASRVLGYRLRNVITGDQYRKPDPRALESLVGDEPGLYLGDTFNDRLLVENFREEGGNFSFIRIDEDNSAEEVLTRILNERREE